MLKILEDFMLDEKGASEEVFKLATAVVIAASVFVLIICLVSLVNESLSPSVKDTCNILLNETTSNAEKIDE